MDRKATPLKWLDDYSLWADYGGTLRLYDFDGANQQAIMPVVQGTEFNVTLSQNNKYLYAIAKTDNGFTLERARMILK